jgi:putative endonuclease
MRYYVYVLYDQNRFYVGITRDLKRRLQEHFSGHVYSTRRYSRENLRLVFAEMFISRDDAERRETYLKTTKGRKALKLMLRETLRCPEPDRRSVPGKPGTDCILVPGWIED